MDRGNGAGSLNDLPWASVFDPAANARALSAIQAEGFRAASAIVDRFARMATSSLNGSDQASTSSAPLTNEQRADLLGATDFEPLIRSWWSMLGQFLLGSAPGHPDSAPAVAAGLDFSNAQAEGRLDLEATSPGAATTEVWLHNRSAEGLGEIRLRCSDLLAHDGSVIRSGAITFSPGAIPMPARSSRGIDMTIEVPQGVEPGVYRGTLLVEGRPELWLSVVLTLRASVS